MKNQTRGRNPHKSSLSTLTPFACGICKEEFTDIRKLYEHCQIHDGVTKGEFHVCDFDSLVNNTMGKYSDYRHFVCNVCLTAFPTICQLHKHLEASNNIESYRVYLGNRNVFPEPPVCVHAGNAMNVKTSDTTDTEKFNDPKLESSCFVKLEDVSKVLDGGLNETEMDNESDSSVSNFERESETNMYDDKKDAIIDTREDTENETDIVSKESKILNESPTNKPENVQDVNLKQELGKKGHGFKKENLADSVTDIKMHTEIKDTDGEYPKDNIPLASKEDISREQKSKGTKCIKGKSRRRRSNVHYTGENKSKRKLRIMREISRAKHKNQQRQTELCGLCRKRYSLDEIEAHKIEHLRESGCSVDQDREDYGSETTEENLPMIRPHRRKFMDFTKYAESDCDSDREDGDSKAVEEDRPEVRIQKKECTTSANYCNSDVNSNNHEDKVDRKNYIFEAKSKTQTQMETEKFEEKHSDKREKESDTWLEYNSGKEMLKQIDTVSGNSQDERNLHEERNKVKLGTCSQFTTDKFGADIRPGMNPSQVKEAKRRFRSKEVYRPSIDYDWDCVPKRKKKQDMIKYYKTCKLCGIMLVPTKMQHHLEEHQTERGKSKFSPENLVKCKKCFRICLKSGFSLHKCFKELINRKIDESDESRQDVESKLPQDMEEDEGKPTHLICPECGILIKRGTSMKKHMIMAHSEERPYSCTICEKSFKLQALLKNHMKIVHIEERSNHCDQCTKAFSTPYALKAHYMVHTDERRFLCPKCPKRFRKMYTLKVHVAAVHENEVPKFQCPHCSKLVKSKSSLTMHVESVHLKLKSWICSWPDCGEMFYAGKNLRRHMCRHTGEKPLSCDHCECAYVQSTELLAHMKSKHNIHELPQSKKYHFPVKTYKKYIFDVGPAETDGRMMKSIMFQAANSTLA